MRLLLLGLISVISVSDVAGQEWTPTPVSIDSVAWRGGNGIESAVIDGDTQTEGGSFTMLLRLAPGAWIPPHSHNVAKRILVLEGSLLFGHGEQQDTTAVTRIPQGGFMLVPAERPHYEGTREPTVVALYGIGPFRTTFVGR